MGTTVINGTSGNDFIQAHPDGDYNAGQLVFVLGGMPSQGGWPAVEFLVNGQVVLANYTITSDVLAGHTQTVSVPLPGGALSSVGIRYLNDLVTQVDDRNVYVGSVTLNGVSLALGSATYVRDDYPTIAGTTGMNWNGTMTWSGPAVQNSTVTGTQASNASIDAGAGTDIVMYLGRASGYGIAATAGGFTVTPRTGAFAPDTVSNIENLLFDDRAPYVHGAGGAASVDAAMGVIDGGAGIDTLYLRGSLTQYTINHTATGFSVTGNGVNEWVTNVERLAFTDGFIGLDIHGDAGMAYRLYQAALDRKPDGGGLGFWITMMDNGMSLTQVAANFVASAEFQGTYGNLSNNQFATQLYHNVLDREPDAGGLAFWTDALDSGRLSRPEVLAAFSESNENQANLIGAIQDGMYYNILF
jgi:hypothetical protein